MRTSSRRVKVVLDIALIIYVKNTQGQPKLGKVSPLGWLGAGRRGVMVIIKLDVWLYIMIKLIHLSF